MSDTYDAIYTAARNAFSGAGAAIADAARQSLDFSFEKERIEEAFQCVASEMQRPSVLMRPTLMRDGNAWCALYGENIQVGVCGFGDTPDEAMRAFDSAWNTERAERARA